MVRLELTNNVRKDNWSKNKKEKEHERIQLKDSQKQYLIDKRRTLSLCNRLGQWSATNAEKQTNKRISICVSKL